MSSQSQHIPIALLITVCLCASVKAGSCSEFDVVSIKINTTGAGGGYPELAPGGKRFTATNQLMLELIMSAYEVAPRQIAGIPGGTLSQQRYDIDAACEQPIPKEQIPSLLRKALASRFQLSVHREWREQPVYALLVGKGGPRLPASTQSTEIGQPGLRQSGHSFLFSNSTMDHLAGVLSQVAGRKVIDKTALSGRYDFALRYSPNAAADDLPESVFTAVQKQLGLRLESQRSPVEFIVVDRLGRLVAN